MEEIKPYEEYEIDRIDGLIEELREEKKKLRKEMREKIPELTREAVHNLDSSALAHIVFEFLGGYGKIEVESRHFPSMGGGMGGGHVNFIFHHFNVFNDHEMHLLSGLSLYSGQPEDDRPTYETDISDCSVHTNCIEADISVWYSENDWEHLTKPAKPSQKAKPKSK